MRMIEVTLTVSGAEFVKLLDNLSRNQMKGMVIAPAPGNGKVVSSDKPANKAAVATQKTVLCKGDRTDSPGGSIKPKILIEHEKLEAKHGIGNVTRAMLTARAVTKITEYPSNPISQLVKDGWLQPL